MKRMLSALILAGISFSSTLAANWFCCPPDYTFYLQVETGISCSEPAKVHAPPSTWTPAVQGYNSKLGNQAIIGLSLGCEFNRFIDVDLGISTRSTYKYRKFQTPVTGGNSYKREFDLNVTPILLSVGILGRNISCLNWNFACGKLYPIIGVGLGAGNLLITNFRTTGLPSSGASGPFPSFSNENQRTVHNNFAYTGFIGCEYNYNDCWAIKTGYRRFDAGKFKGPRFLRVASGDSVDVHGEEWKMRFRSNEWFIEFKLFI